MTNLNRSLFDSTEVAFRHLDTTSLRIAASLFWLMEKEKLSHLGQKMLQSAIELRLPVQSLVKSTLFKQFCGGESLDECLQTMFKLAEQGIGAMLNFAVEGKSEEADFVKTAREILLIISTLEAQQSSLKQTFVVVKMTGLMRSHILAQQSANKTLTLKEKQEWEQGRSRLRSLCAQALQSQICLLIDAEESWLQPAIDHLALEMMEEFNENEVFIYTTLQMYRHDKFDYLRYLYERAQKLDFHIGAKLVRGAYLEGEAEFAQRTNQVSPLFAKKTETDQAYDQALEFCINHYDRIATFAATHNEKSTELFVQLLEKLPTESQNKRFVFAQLLGMNDNITYKLAELGYNVVKFIPYGPVADTIPYLIRRAAENSSIQGQVNRNLELLKRELSRRKKT